MPNGLRNTYTYYYNNKNNLVTAVHIPGSGQLNFAHLFWLRPQTLLLLGGGKVTFCFDAETGLHYNYFRSYKPAIGRYSQSDPIGLKEGLNYDV